LSEERIWPWFDGSLSDVPPGGSGDAIAYEAAAVVVNPSAELKI
jgi:hypothetical protein